MRSADGELRERGMRRFGDLEAVIMDRSCERDWPMLVREMVDDLRGRAAASYFSVGMVGAGGGPPAPVGHELHLLPFLRPSRIRSMTPVARCVLTFYGHPRAVRSYVVQAR